MQRRAVAVQHGAQALVQGLQEAADAVDRLYLFAEEPSVFAEEVIRARRETHGTRELYGSSFSAFSTTC